MNQTCWAARALGNKAHVSWPFSNTCCWLLRLSFYSYCLLTSNMKIHRLQPVVVVAGCFPVDCLGSTSWAVVAVACSLKGFPAIDPISLMSTLQGCPESFDRPSIRHKKNTVTHVEPHPVAATATRDGTTTTTARQLWPQRMFPTKDVSSHWSCPHGGALNQVVSYQPGAQMVPARPPLPPRAPQSPQLLVKVVGKHCKHAIFVTELWKKSKPTNYSMVFAHHEH